MSALPLLKISNLSKSYSGNQVLQDFSLTINDGEFFTLLGPSGCGKTTVLRMIAGFESPDFGTIVLDNTDIAVLSAEKRPVNTVFQSYALFPHMSVFENVAFGLKMSKTNKADIENKVIEALAMVQLEKFADRKPHQLSGGQQQRVAIARAVVNKPRLLLLDESLSALDYKLRQQMQIELKRLQRKLGISFVYVTHDQEEALSMSDRILVMKNGEVQQLGTPKEIYENPQNLFVAKFIGEINQFEATVLRRVDADHIEVQAEGTSWVVKSNHNFTIGEKAHVLMRPEDLRLINVDQIDEHVHVLGTVYERSYKGKTLDSYVRLNSGTEIVASEFFNEDDPDFDYSIDQVVAVQWVTGWEVVLPHETSL